MTKVFKKLGALSLALVLGVVLLGATAALAESPPNPPSRFVGSVTIDGVPATPGTVVEARIGAATCGVTTVFSGSGQSRFQLDSPALDPGATPNCGTEGAKVDFYVGGKKANEQGDWHNYQLNTVNLTVTTPTPSPTPKAPAAGSGLESGSGSQAAWLFAAFGLGALAFGVGGAAVARKSR